MMHSYGATEVLPLQAPQRRTLPSILAVAAGTLAVCAIVLMAGSSFLRGKEAISLEEMEFVPVEQLRIGGGAPMQVLALGDDQAKNLPLERHWETDGWPTMVKCPGAWCTKTPFRVYPDNRKAFAGDDNFPLAWGACNIAIQDC